ncbi:MAG TPA: isoprenylcysteine carboxylmethyltransferase family protein [Scandinavium sp.]|jgi:protein-S-isoprenylcysteine O-methyltransferase Ste14
MNKSMYDLLMRLPLLGWVAFTATAQLRGLGQFMNMATPVDFVYGIHLAMRLSTVAFLLLAAAAVILRTRPSGKATGAEPRISALAGSFMLYIIVLFPRHELPLSLEMVSTAVTLIGTVGSVIALAQLGRSFSIMAETRQLVTSGPYRFVRHPLYLTEEIATIGVFMQFASAWTALLVVLQLGFQLRRMQNEEAVLTVSFPEYGEYRQTTARLIPGIY